MSLVSLSTIEKSVKDVLGVMADVSTPHTLMKSQTLAMLFSSAVFVLLASVVISIVRAFNAASPDSPQIDVVMSIVAVLVMIVASVVALRVKAADGTLVYEECAKFAACTLTLFLVSAFIYAVLYGMTTEFLGETPSNYFSPYKNVPKLFFATVASLIGVAGFGWRSKRVHQAVWDQVDGKGFWLTFYIVLVIALLMVTTAL